MADGRHRDTQLMGECKQLYRLVMLKQPAENNDFSFFSRIFKVIRRLKRLFKSLKSTGVCFYLNTKPCYFVKYNAVCGK
ncbi:hypothetical protein AB4Z50_07850 [Paenibacillus sp. 2TAB26]|uniref:hypothetical protein n=1 Tax=Paenibacillus sp. 2TAB26 TaxID=3233005 RepID=UPI003F972B66